MQLKLKQNDVELKIDTSSENSFKEGMKKLKAQINFTRKLYNKAEAHLKSMEETYNKSLFNYIVSDEDKLEKNDEPIIIFKEFIPFEFNMDNYIIGPDVFIAGIKCYKCNSKID